MLQVIVLAAGAATRFGSPKQLARIDDQPLLRIVLNRAIEVSGSGVSLVLGAHAAQIAPLSGKSPVAVLVNRHWEEGIASSIRTGVERLPGSCSAVLLMLGDQLGVTSADLQRLVDTWRRQPQCIVAAQYGGATGVPAIFPRSEFGALLQLRGDRGAQALLRRAPERVITVPLAGGALDIDTPEDLQRALALRSQPGD